MRIGAILWVIWLINLAIAAGIGYVIVNHLMIHPDENPLDDLGGDQEAPPPEQTGPTLQQMMVTAKNLGNPLLKWAPEPPAATAVSPLKGLVTLIATVPSGVNEKNALIAVKVTIPGTKEYEVPVQFGESVPDLGGKPVPSLAMWKLKKVFKDHADFVSDSGGATETLKVQDASTTGTGATGTGSGALQNFGLQDINGQTVFSDATLDYISRDADRIMKEDVKYDADPNGGIRITDIKPGSIAAAGGFLKEDVVKMVNGRPISAPSDLRGIMNELQTGRAGDVVITIQRMGQPKNIPFKRMPR